MINFSAQPFLLDAMIMKRCLLPQASFLNALYHDGHDIIIVDCAQLGLTCYYILIVNCIIRDLFYKFDNPVLTTKEIYLKIYSLFICTGSLVITAIIRFFQKQFYIKQITAFKILTQGSILCLYCCFIVYCMLKETNACINT